jgi:hypothetical protein
MHEFFPSLGLPFEGFQVVQVAAERPDQERARIRYPVDSVRVHSNKIGTGAAFI